MTHQASQTKSPHLLNLIFSPQHTEFTVDAPPDECVKRLLTLSRFDRKVKITEMDGEKGYDFKIDIRRNFKGEYTSAICDGFIVKAQEPSKSFVCYEYRATLLQRSGIIYFAVLGLYTLVASLSTSNFNIGVVTVAGIFMLFVYLFVYQVKQDNNLGVIISDALQANY